MKKFAKKKISRELVKKSQQREHEKSHDRGETCEKSSVTNLLSERAQKNSRTNHKKL